MGKEIEPAFERLSALRERAGEIARSLPIEARHLLEESLEELGVSLEELRVAFDTQKEISDALAETQGAVEEARERYADLFHWTSDGLLVTTGTGEIIDANMAAQALLNRTPKILLGRPASSMIQRRDQPALRELLAQLRDGTIEHGFLEATLARPGAGTVPASIHVTARRAPDGLTLRWSIRDETAGLEMGRLSYAASHDQLTGLLNRQEFLAQVQQMLDTSAQNTSPVGVLFIDLDRFKDVNDLLGHDAGDELLNVVAGRLRHVIREGDVVARLGGDEFAVATVSDTTGASLQILAGRIVAAIEEPYHLDLGSANVTASVGSSLSGHDELNAEHFLRQADQAMYSAKHFGPGRTELYGPQLQERIRARQHTQSQIRDALDHNKLALVYQPIVDLATGSPRSLEALVRIRAEDGSLIVAGDFIEVAEETGLVTEIGRWVLDQCSRDMSAWQQAGLANSLRIAVNMSPPELRQPAIVEHIESALTRAGGDGRWLCIELTERSAVDMLSDTRDLLHTLRDWGVSLAVDDFGTGYSSLGFLRALRVQMVKIDQSFVRQLETSHEDRLIIAAMAGLSELMDFELVAEGIENPAHLSALAELGVPLGQGFLLARPSDAEGITHMLATRWHADRSVTVAPALSIPTANGRT